MTKNWAILLLSTAILAGCGGGDGADAVGGGSGFLGGADGGGSGGGAGGGGGGETPPTTPTDPSAALDGSDTCAADFVCNEDVLTVTYDAGSDAVTIVGTPFDETPLAATYVTAASVGVPYVNVAGFTAYVNEEFVSDPTKFNNYLAYFKTSADGSVTVGQTRVMDGYRDRGYGGVFYRLDAPANIPTMELATYTGQYAGILVFDGSSDSYQTTGDLTFWVDFTDAYVKGWTENRRALGSAIDIGDLIFDDTPIVDGQFNGQAINFDATMQPYYEGYYGGVFGGVDAATMGGWFEVQAPDFGGDDTVQPIEIGTFVITKD